MMFACRWRITHKGRCWTQVSGVDPRRGNLGPVLKKWTWNTGFLPCCLIPVMVESSSHITFMCVLVLRKNFAHKVSKRSKALSAGEPVLPVLASVVIILSSHGSEKLQSYLFLMLHHKGIHKAHGKDEDSN